MTAPQNPSPRGSAAGRALKRLTAPLPPVRRQALIDVAVAGKVALTGRGTPPRLIGAPQPRAKGNRPAGRAVEGLGVGRAVGPPLSMLDRPEPEWKTAPEITTYGRVASLYDHDAPPTVFDADLLDRLNEEYRPKKVVKSAPTYGGPVLDVAARRRLMWADRMVDLRGKRVLEIGCGSALEVWSLAHNFGCEAYGVDVTEYGAWQHLRDDRVDLRMVDLTYDNPFGADYFDRIVSFTVWEHVPHPHAMLARAYELLKPGGLMWIRANLFAGPQASHRYKDITFPWPHLLFSDDVVREWDARHGRSPRGFAWVNRLSWRHYEDYILRTGFRIRYLKFDRVDLDRPFYERFESVLGRYPVWDLTTDYFLAVLEKPADAGSPGAGGA